MDDTHLLLFWFNWAFSYDNIMQGPALLSNHVFIVIVNIMGSILWLNYVFSCEDKHNAQVIGQRFGWFEYAVETVDVT